MLTKESEINLGTKAKPVIKTVEEWVAIARQNAEDLNNEINENLSKLNEKYI
jgi:hypothetical protein